MDAAGFDWLTRALGGLPRRGMIRGTLGISLTVLANGGDVNVLGKKRRKRKKPCGGNRKRCNGSCVDIQTDEENCGECGVACQPLESCAQSACICVGTNRQVCSGVCVDLATDANNCGECGLVCESGECVNGACTCNGGQSQCLAGCACSNRIGSGKVCFKGGNNGIDCDSDGDCPFRSLCFSINKCSIPCVA